MVCAGNGIRDAGAQAVAEKLGSVPGLTTLDLGSMQHAGAEGERADQGSWLRVGGGKCIVLEWGEGSGAVALRIMQLLVVLGSSGSK